MIGNRLLKRECGCLESNLEGLVVFSSHLHYNQQSTTSTQSEKVRRGINEGRKEEKPTKYLFLPLYNNLKIDYVRV